MRFLVDSTAGRLARFLRLLGLDTEYQKEPDLRILIEKAKKEKRIILTRNKKIKQLCDDVLLLESDYHYDQAIQVIKNFGLKDKISPFSRCLECNQPLEEVKKEEAKGKVPFYVWLTHEKFSRCPLCGKYYWEGTHTRELRKKISLIIERLD